MNPTDELFPHIDKEVLDLLVDGELDESRRRALLTALDAEPAGWRRCALAFLEAQCWKQECRSLAQPAPPVGGVSDGDRIVGDRTTVKPAKRKRWLDRHVGTLLAVAASFFLALGISSMLRQSPRDGAPMQLPSSQYADVARSALSPRPAPRRPDRPATPWRMVRLSGAGADGSRVTVLPAVERQSYAEARLADAPSAVPPELLRALERAGHEVRQSRRWVPYRLRDGRRLVVPVDELDVHYVGGPRYQ
jgi:hypothetical protein